MRWGRCYRLRGSLLGEVDLFYFVVRAVWIVIFWREEARYKFLEDVDKSLN